MGIRGFLGRSRGNSQVQPPPLPQPSPAPAPAPAPPPPPPDPIDPDLALIERAIREDRVSAWESQGSVGYIGELKFELFAAERFQSSLTVFRKSPRTRDWEVISKMQASRDRSNGELIIELLEIGGTKYRQQTTDFIAKQVRESPPRKRADVELGR